MFPVLLCALEGARKLHQKGKEEKNETGKHGCIIILKKHFYANACNS